jgi:hypothetical protein
MSWKDGGLSLPSVEHRLDTMVARTIVQLLGTKDLELRMIFRAFMDEERENRHFSNSPEDTIKTGYFDWHHTALSGLSPEVETTTIFWKGYEAALRIGLEISATGRNLDRCTIKHRLAAEKVDVTSKDVSQYITQKVFRQKGLGGGVMVVACHCTLGPRFDS